MDKTEFFNRFIKNKPRNLYTPDNSIIEIFDENASGDSLSTATSQKASVVPINSCAARKEKKKRFLKLCFIVTMLTGRHEPINGSQNHFGYIGCFMTIHDMESFWTGESVSSFHSCYPCFVTSYLNSSCFWLHEETIHLCHCLPIRDSQ